MCRNNCVVAYDKIGLFSINPMWRSLNHSEEERIFGIAAEIALKSEEYIRRIASFRLNSFSQARYGNGIWFVPKELDRSANLSKLPYSLVLHFGLEGHKNRGTLNMALTQIENRLKKEIQIRNYKKFKISNCINIFCAPGIVDALTTPFFIGFCKNKIDAMSDVELRVLIGHEASHKFHDTQDYYYMYDEKKIYDAYSWGMIYGE